jgi:hypothetical protein
VKNVPARAVAPFDQPCDARPEREGQERGPGREDERVADDPRDERIAVNVEDVGEGQRARAGRGFFGERGVDEGHEWDADQPRHDGDAGAEEQVRGAQRQCEARPTSSV